MLVSFVIMTRFFTMLGLFITVVQSLTLNPVLAEPTPDETLALATNSQAEVASTTGNLSVVTPPIDLHSAEFLGDPSARLILVEFSDPQCSFAAQHATRTFPHIRDQYVQSGKLRYAVLDFPRKAQPFAFSAAEAMHCAGDQGQYWRMRDRLFDFQGNLGADELPYHARALQLNVLRFRHCLRTSTFASRVNAGMAEASKAQVQGTPTFFLGTTTNDGQLQVLTTIDGAQPFAQFQSAIDSLLTTLR